MECGARWTRAQGARDSTGLGWVGLGWLIVIPGRDPGKPVLLLRNPRPQPPRSSLPLPPCTPDPPPARPPERPRPLCLQHGPLAQQRRGGRGVNCAQELPAALHHPHPPGCHSDHPPAGGGVHKVQRHLRRGGTGRGGTQRSTGKGRKRQLCGREKRERRPGAAFRRCNELHGATGPLVGTTTWGQPYIQILYRVCRPGSARMYRRTDIIRDRSLDGPLGKRTVRACVRPHITSRHTATPHSHAAP